MELPPELRNLFMVLTGSEWPTADETRLWQLAQVYGTTADRLQVELPQLVIRIKNKVRENFDATAADFFDESVDQFTAGERNYLGEGTAVARGLQEYVHNAGTQVQYAKWMIIGQLVQLAAEIAWAIAMAPFTFGASLAKIPIFQAIARTVVGRVMFRLISELLQQMMISQFFALTLDALIQRIQIDNGVRDEWDTKLTEDAAKGAMLDGLFGTAAAFGGNALSDQFNRLLGNNTGPAIAHQLDDRFPPGNGPGTGDGLPEGIGTVMGRNGDELLRPYGMDDRPGWSRPVDGERFRADMGDRFADSLGGAMGRDQAREFGERYADAFARHWGRGGLDDALGGVVSAYGRGLDPKMRDFLTTGVPGGVRDGLSDVGSHWKNFLAQLGGQGIANAAQGILGEGFFNLLFSDEKTFSITWLSGVSGFVSGAVQQSLTQGGLMLIDQLKGAGLPDGVPELPDPPMGPHPEDGHRGTGDDSPDRIGGAPGTGSGSDQPSPDRSSSEEDGGTRGPQGDGTPDQRAGGTRGAQDGDTTAVSPEAPAPPPPDRVVTESSATNGPTDTGPYRPAAPNSGNPGADSLPETGGAPVRGSDEAVDTPAEDVPTPNTTSRDVPNQDVPTRNAPGHDATVGNAPVEEAPVRDGFVQEVPVGNTPAEEAPVQDASDQNAPVREVPNQGGAVFDRPDQRVPENTAQVNDGGGASGVGASDSTGAAPISGGPERSPDGQDRTSDEDAPTRVTEDRTDADGQTPAAPAPAPAPNPSPAPNGQGADGGTANPPRPDGEGAGEGRDDVRPRDGEEIGEGSGPGAPSRGEGDQQGPPRDSGDLGAPAPADGRAQDPPQHANGAPGPAVAPPSVNPAAQGQEPAGDGHRQAPPTSRTDTPPAARPRPEPDAPAPVAEGLRPPGAWQDARDGAETARVGTNRDGSGIDTDGVEILDGSTGDRPIVSVAERGFDVRRVPLPDPGPEGPTHVTELTVRINFDPGDDVRPEEADTAQRVFLDRVDDVLNQRYRLPDSGDQLHVRVEPVGADDRPHADVTWVRDNPDLPGRSDTANWRLDDGADVWLHETLHRLGLDDEYRDPPQERSGRPQAVLRGSPDSTAVHEVGGYMDAPGGHDGRPPEILNRYLEQIESQAHGASRYDPPARLADLPDPAHRDLAALLDPEGRQDPSDTVSLFGAAYDSRVRGLGEDRVRADLPPRLRDRFDRTVAEWTSDGRLERALGTARTAGMEAPLSRMPGRPAPVPTEGGAEHRAAGPLSDIFRPRDGSGGSGGSRPEDHPMRDLSENRHRNSGNRGDGTTGGTGEGTSGAPRRETPPSQQDRPQPIQNDQLAQNEPTRQGPPRPVGTEATGVPPERPPTARPVDAETVRMLDALADAGTDVDGGGYPGLRVNSGADAQGLGRRLRDQLTRHGVEPDGTALGEALDRITDGRARPGDEIGVPVREVPAGDRAGRDGAPPPVRGQVRFTVERAWRETTDSPDRRIGATHTVETRAKAVGAGAQQSRKSVNPVLPATVIGSIAGKTMLISPRLKGSIAVRQRGSEYQTSAERRHKRKVDVDGENPARFTADLTVTASLEVAPPPVPPDGGAERQGTSGQQPPPGRPETQDRSERQDGRERPPRPPEPVRFTDRLDDAFDVVLPGHVRDGDGAVDGGGQRTADPREAPRQFRTDDPASRVGDGDGTPVRAPRFSRTLGVLDGGPPENFPLDMRTLRETLGRMDHGEVLHVPYRDDSGDWQFAELSGGPVAYERIGPEMADSSFSDTDKSSTNAQSNVGRTNKQEIRAGASFLGTIIPGAGSSSLLRVGPEVVGGVKGAQKYTRATEHGSERVHGPGTKGDSAFYRVTRTYRVTTTEQQHAAPDAAGHHDGPVRHQPRVRAGTLDLTTLDQVSTSDARALAGDGAGHDPRGGPAAPATPGLRADRVEHLGESVPVRAEWNDGRLRDTNGEAPLTAVANRVHRAVFAAHPELVNDPAGPGGDRRGFWGRLWRGPDLRALNTLAIHEQVGRAAAEADSLITDGVRIVLRAGGLRNALTPAPGRLRTAVGALPGASSVRTDDRDGADFVTVRLSGRLDDARFAGSRRGGSLSSGLNASTSQGSGRQNTTAYGAEGSAALQVRPGETAAAMPRGIVEVGAGYAYEREKTTPASGTRKSGVESSSSAKGELDAWTYALHLEASIGSNAPVDVTPTGAGATAAGPRLLVEGPRTAPVPGELGPFDPETDRAAEADRARTDARQALDQVRQARGRVDELRAERDRLAGLTEELPGREASLVVAQGEADSARQEAAQDDRAAQTRERTAAKAENVAREARRQAVLDRLEAARAQQEAADLRRNAIEKMRAYAEALRTETEARDRSGRHDGGAAQPSRERTPAPAPLPQPRDTGADALGDDADQSAVDRAWDTAVENWEALEDAARDAGGEVRAAETAFRAPPRQSSSDGGTAAPPRPTTPPAVEKPRTAAREAVQATDRRNEEADAQDDRATGAEENAELREGEASDRRAEADTARRKADGSKRLVEEAGLRVNEARQDHDESVAAKRDLPARERELTEALDDERRAHAGAAAAHGRGEEHRFALERDARLRTPGGDRTDDDRDRTGAPDPGDRAGTPRPRADLDLDALPHAPKHTEARSLWDTVVEAVRSAPGFTAASRSGEAVIGHWRVLSSAKALAAHTMDVHNGGLPLQGQFEDGVRRRADLSLTLHAERTSMRTSGALRESGVDLTYKTESDRVTGAGRSSSHNTAVGVKGQGTPNPADTRNNRLRFSAGAVPYASKQTRTEGDTTTFGEEDKVSLSGSTVDVTTADRFTVRARIRSRWNLLVSVPYSSTTESAGAPGPAGPADATGGTGGDRDDGARDDAAPDRHGEPGSTEARYRVLDLAQNAALPGTSGLDAALARSRAAPDGTGFVPGRESSGYALNGIDTAGAVEGIAQRVRGRGVELTEQSKHDIQVALSATNTRGTNRRLQTGGLVLPVRVLEDTFGEQRFSSGGWLRLELGRNGDPAFGPVESGLSSERSVSESTEHNESRGMQKKHGVTATVDGGFNPVPATGTGPGGAPAFPGDRYYTNTGTVGTGWETATTSTELASDTDTRNTSRTVKAPGVTATTPMRVDFTLSVDNWRGGSRGPVITDTVDVGNRREVFQAGTFRPTAPPSAPVASAPVAPSRAGADDPEVFARDWRGRLGRGETALPPVEGVGQRPIADAALLAQARALGWQPDAAERVTPGAAAEHLREGRPGSRAHMLGAAVDEQVLRGLFDAASGSGGAVLVGRDPQGPFAVPGLETRLFTQVAPGGATVIGATEELATGNDTQKLHRDERATAHAGSTALTTGLDLSGIKAVQQPVSDFNESRALVGGGLATAGANSTAAGGGKQSSSTMRTDTAAPVKGRGYLVRFPVDALLIAQDTASGGPPRAEWAKSTVDVWLSTDQLRTIATGVNDDSVASWDTVARRQTEAAATEKALGAAVDREAGLDRSEEARASARAAADLLSLGSEADPRIWTPETSDGVRAVRDYLGSTDDDHGWGRPADRTEAEHRAALDGLTVLQRGAGTLGGLPAETVEALRDLVERRNALHTALSSHRAALDAYFTALDTAFAPPTRPDPPAPTDPPSPPAGTTPLQAAFDSALNPPAG
ncbi:WXG100-like domain-containing protein [Nocardiopsis terrae]